MRTFQKWLIAGVLVLPIVIGVVAALSNGLRERGLARYAPASLKRIGLVELKGTIIDAREWVRQLQSFRLDNTIVGVILQIDSPGGAVAPSQEIYAEVLKFRSCRKPIVVSMSTVAASGAYYAASPATRIFADPGSLTGSIGVIFTLPLFEELSKKIGVQFRVFKAGDFKDVGSPYRAMTEGEKRFIQDLLKDTHEQFIADVARARGMQADTLARYADGRVLTGRQACAARLIDTLGGYDDALDWLRDKTGLGPGAKVIERKPRSSRLREWFEEESAALFPPLAHLFRPAGLYSLMSLD